MTAINSKATKAQLLEYIGELQADLDTAERKVAALEVPFTERVGLIGNEIIAFCEDVYRLGAFCRKASQPLLDKAILIVNN